MKSEKKKFIDLLVSSGCLKFGDFTLKSGVWSPFFLNLGNVTSGLQLQEMGDVLAGTIATLYPEVSVLFGPAYKGIPMVTAAACSLSAMGREVEILYDRKEAKGHGEGGNFIGCEPDPNDRVVLIDDVYTSGGTKVAGVHKLRDTFEVEVQGIVVAMDRRVEGVLVDPALPPLHSLVNMLDLVDFLADEKNPMSDSVLRYYKGES